MDLSIRDTHQLSHKTSQHLVSSSNHLNTIEHSRQSTPTQLSTDLAMPNALTPSNSNTNMNKIESVDNELSFQRQQTLIEKFLQTPTTELNNSHDNLTQPENLILAGNEKGFSLRTNLSRRPSRYLETGLWIANSLPFIHHLRLDRFIKESATNTPIVALVRDEYQKLIALNADFSDNHGELRMDVCFDQPVPQGRYTAEIYSVGLFGHSNGKVGDIQIQIQTTPRNWITAEGTATEPLDDLYHSDRLYTIFDIDNTVYHSPFIQLTLSYTTRFLGIPLSNTIT